MVDETPKILQEQLNVQKEQNQKQDKANAEQSAERQKMNDILLKMKGVDEKRLDAIRDQVKVFEERELKLEEQKQAIESLGLKADQNIQLQKDFKQLELDRQAFDESQTQELGRRSVLERLQEKNTLVKSFKNLGDTFKKGFSNLGSRIGDFAKGTLSTIGTSALNIFKTTLFAGFIFALIQFFESEYWEKTKDFIVSIVEGGENSPLAKFKDTMSNLLTIFTSIAGLTAVGLLMKLLGRKPVAGAKSGGGLLASLLTALGLGSLFGGKADDIGPRPPIDKAKDKFSLKRLGKSLFTFAGLRAAITRFGLPGLIIGLFVLPALEAIADLVFTDEQKEKFKKDAEQFKTDTFDFLDKINIFKKDNEFMKNVDDFFNNTLPNQFDKAAESFNKNVIESIEEDGILKTLFPKLKKEDLPPQLQKVEPQDSEIIMDNDAKKDLEISNERLMKFIDDRILRPPFLSDLKPVINDITNDELTSNEKFDQIIRGMDEALSGELIDADPNVNIERQINNNYMLDQTDVINELKKEKAFREQLLQDLSNLINTEKNNNATVNVINAPSTSKIENSSSTTSVRPIVDMDLSIQKMLHARGYAF